MKTERFLCKECKNPLKTDRDKVGFFDKQAIERLAERYENFTYEAFRESLKMRELFQMDLLNKKVGIAKKFWWEPHLGKITGSSILEVGCGVNYLVPYWLDSGNDVTAFDICKENMMLLKKILKNLNMKGKKCELFVGDAEYLQLDRRFDVINVNNVLHHIKNKKEVLVRLKDHLKDDGKILIVDPNYYYPFRWVIETDFLESFNFVKDYFVRYDLIEKGEKAVIFRELKKIIKESGFKIEVNEKDNNYLGYGITYFIDRNKYLPRLIYAVDRYFLGPLLPRLIAPFEYLILSKA